MGKQKRCLAALLAACLLTGCGAKPLPVVEDAPKGEMLAYVPLDDRPVNTDRVAYLAESLGYDLRLPEQDWYHTCLDGQAANATGLRTGDRGALWSWVEAQEAAGCDRYILSLDQLLSGGLVNSRSVAAQMPILGADGQEITAAEALERYLTPLAADPDNQIYLLDTVMRLAPTVGYDGFDLAGYGTLRAYGMAERPALSEAELTVETIVAGYGLGADGQWVEADPTLTDAQIRDYLAARERKLRLADEALTLTEGMENVHFLIGVDDSAPSGSIQTNEIRYLKQAVAGRGAVLSGADEDGMLAVCRLYAETRYTGPLPTAWVRYFGGSESGASSDYDHQPMTEIVAAHLDYLGVEQAEGPSADLQVLVLTAPAEPEQAEAYCDALIAALRENEENGVPTVLLDAAKNGYGTAFQAKLVRQTSLGALLGYAGFYDLANVTGIALSNGVARWLRLRGGEVRSTAQEQAFLRTLADSLLKDICYKNDAKIAMTTYVRQELAGDPDNFARTGTDPDTVQAQLGKEMQRATRAVAENLQRSNFLISLEGAVSGWGTVTLEHFRYPWQRVFELRMDLVLGGFTEPHQRVLWFYT